MATAPGDAPYVGQLMRLGLGERELVDSPHDLAYHHPDLQPALSAASQERQPKRTDSRQPDHRPARNHHLLIRERCTGIPHQMPQAVQAVIRERERQSQLRNYLHNHR